MEENSFDVHIKNLFKISSEIHDKLYGSLLNTNQQFWFICIQKFGAVYAQSGKIAPFIEIFEKFYKKNLEYFEQKILVENEEGNFSVNDEWLIIPSESKKETKSKGSPLFEKCKGKVIYFDESKPKLMAVCIPISEIYTSAIKLFKEKGEKNNSHRLYRIKLLETFFSIFNLIDPQNEILSENLKELKDQIDIYSPPTNSSSSSSSGGESNLGGGIGKLINGVLSGAGIKNGFNAKNIDTLIGKAASEDNMNKISGVIKEVVGVFQGPQKKEGIDGILDNIKAAVDLPAVKDVVKDVSNLNLNEITSTGTEGTEGTEGTGPIGGNGEYSQEELIMAEEQS